MRMKGSQALIEALKLEGVDTVFGYPGGAALPLYDALYDSDLRHILPRHEQGAAHAADGYARASGKVGVCFATSGPGATNLVTGIATAYMDSVPLVCITCQVASPLLGKDSFQEADISGITTPITKHNFMLHTVEEIPSVLRRAFYIARTGRPGPVVIDIPKDLFTQMLEFSYPEDIATLFMGYKPVSSGEQADLEAVADALIWSHFPVLFVGGGVISAGVSDALRELVARTNIPVVTTIMGIGAFPADSPNFVGMVGMHGTYAANMTVMHSDLVIGVGVRFDDRVTGVLDHYAPGARIAHFDIDKAELKKNVRVDFRVVADLAWSLPRFAKMAETHDLTSWHAQIAEWKQAHPLVYTAGKDGRMKPQQALEILDKKIPQQAIVVTDVGQHQMWSALYFTRSEPRTFLTSGGLGTMGFGLPAGIGAQVACPDKEVWVICGDGGIMMNCQELATAAEIGAPVRILILNNRGLGMVRQWQRLFFNNRYSGSKHELDMDFALLAEAMQCTGIHAETEAEFVAAVDRARQTVGPVLIDLRVDDDENVLPMVAPGKPLDEMCLTDGREL